MNQETLRAFEGLFVAICGAMRPSAAREASDILAALADHPKTPMAVAICYRQCIHAAEPLTEPIDEDDKPAPTGGILGSHFETDTVH